MGGSHSLSSPFRITRGTRQCSPLSPVFLNVFLDDLLRELNDSPYGLYVEQEKVNSFAYANDVSLIANTITDLQAMINICTNYANKWRFSFGIKKSKCFIAGDIPFQSSPKWELYGNTMNIELSVEILGTIFNHPGTSCDHTAQRIQNCRRARAYYGYSNIGLRYPGLHTEVKLYLWNSICLPVLS